MYEIKVKSSFSAAHNLKNYKGKCEHLHGHNWAVEAVFRYEALDKDGMAIDFRLAKKVLKTVTEKLDHSYMNELKIIKHINPTSENMARFIYDSVKKKNKNIYHISVWENENSCATYSEERVLR
jgi:6-pyruvoyltetrahydropterin/6-carboxytetrahydropterin synthase